MATKISDTILLAGGNLARPTRFTALIAPPPEVVATSDIKVFDVLCKNVSIPSITMEPIEIVYKGHQLKIPGRVNQEQTIELTMYLDEKHSLRKMFENWINGLDNRFYAVNDSSSANMSRNFNFFGNLMIKTRNYNETTEEPMNYLFEGCFPTNVSGPEFGSGNVGEVSEFTVTLSYYRFLSGDTVGNYDNLDSFLSSFGLPANGFSGLGQIGNTLNGIASVGNQISNTFDVVKNIF